MVCVCLRVEVTICNSQLEQHLLKFNTNKAHGRSILMPTQSPATDTHHSHGNVATSESLLLFYFCPTIKKKKHQLALHPSPTPHCPSAPCPPFPFSCISRYNCQDPRDKTFFKDKLVRHQEGLQGRPRCNKASTLKSSSR